MLKTSEKSSVKCFKSGASLPVVITDNGSNTVKAFRQDTLLVRGMMPMKRMKVIQMWIWIVWMSRMMPAQLLRMRKTLSQGSLNTRLHSRNVYVASHNTLQLVVLNFSEDESLKRILKRAFALVRKVNKSSKATKKLILFCHKKLVGNCPTRWSSTYLLIDRLLEVRTPLTQVLEELQWENLMTSEWRTLENLHPLLKPFAQYTSLVSGEEYTTISSVIQLLWKSTFIRGNEKGTGIDSCVNTFAVRAETEVQKVY